MHYGYFTKSSSLHKIYYATLDFRENKESKDRYVRLLNTVVDFLDVMMKTKEATFRIEEVEVREKSNISNKTLAEANLGKRTGVIVIAINQYLPYPSSLIWLGR